MRLAGIVHGCHANRNSRETSVSTIYKQLPTVQSYTLTVVPSSSFVYLLTVYQHIVISSHIRSGQRYLIDI